MTVVRTLAPTTFADGASGFLTHPNPLPVGVQTFLFKLQQISWPLAGGDAIQAAIEYAEDGITFVQHGLTENITDVAFLAYMAVPTGEYRWGDDIPGVGLSTRKVRLRYNFSKSLRISGTIEVL